MLFFNFLEVVPADDLYRTWAADRTIMLRMTSKRVKEIFDKLHPHAVVIINSKWRDANYGITNFEKKLIIYNSIEYMNTWCCISELQLSNCYIDYESIITLLVQCPSLICLDLSNNRIVQPISYNLGSVLIQCQALKYLNLSNNYIIQDEYNSLIGVLGQFSALMQLNLSDNYIGDDEAELLASVLPNCSSLTLLDLSFNYIGDIGVESLAEVIPQCTSLTRLDLRINYLENSVIEELRLRSTLTSLILI
jgi:Ran GTPase-activating protein (RanGAP) involved in mRNA processing and transport